ncbi:MAG: hypothetical protein AAGL89_06535 [Pseudomonadota bacterium]
MQARPGLYILAMIAAVLLALYALVYAILLLAVSAGQLGADTWVFVALLLALAATPFAALVALPKVREGARPRLSVIMMLVMICPALFWGWLFASEIRTSFSYGWYELAVPAGLMGGPAVLSAWLTVAFALSIRGPKTSA